MICTAQDVSAGEGLHLLKVAAYQCHSDVGSAMWLLFVVILLIYSIPNNKAWHVPFMCRFVSIGGHIVVWQQSGSGLL